MKGDRPRITLLGNNAGRNLGDAAIMSSICESLTAELPGAEFYVPSTSPEWTEKNYGKRYRVRPVNVMPWTGSLRLLGIPTLWCLWRSDIALICDGIIFGKKLWNPAFNYLITLVFLVPLARLLGCKVVCYSCGIGPFPSQTSRNFARSVLNGCDLVVMREHDSEKLAREIGCTKPIEVTGDAAFINPVSSRERAQQVLLDLGIDTSKPLFGINVTSYLDSWLGAHERVSDSSRLIESIAQSIKLAQSQIEQPFHPVVFSTHPMDDQACADLARQINGQTVFNSVYLSHDIQAVMRECQLFMGMRFHSVILASAVSTPIIGLIYAPKVRGYMRLLKCEDCAVELAKITPQSLSQTIVDAWKRRDEIRERQRQVIDRLKEGAHRAARRIRERYYPEARVVPQREGVAVFESNGADNGVRLGKAA